MSQPSDNEVIETVRTLERDYATFRETAHIGQDVYTLRRLPKLPKDLVQKEAVYMLSADVKAEAKAIAAFMLGMSKRIEASPTGDEPGATIMEAAKKKASELARALALVLLKLNPYRQLDEQRIMAMMVQPVSLTMLEMGEIEKLHPYANFPFTAYNIDVDGCGWQERGGIPTIFGRHFYQNAREVENAYSHRRGTGQEDKALRMIGGRKWEWVSDDYSIERQPSQQNATSAGPVHRAEMMWLGDNEYLSLVALDSRESWPKQFGPIRNGIVGQSIPQGKLIWSGPNPFGRVPVFMASGSQDLNLRDVADSRTGFLDELVLETQKLAMIDSIIATAALRKASGRRYIKPDTEALRQFIAANQGKWPGNTEWRDDAVPTLHGSVEAWPLDVAPELIDLRDKVEAKIREYKASGFTALLDPQVVKDSTLGSWQGAWNAGIQKLSAPVGRLDTCDRQILQAVEKAVIWLDDHHKDLAQFALVGSGPWIRASGKRIKDGAPVVLNRELIDYPHEIVVESKSVSVTEQQQALALVLARAQPLPNGQPGPFVWDDYWNAIDEDDPETRQVTQAAEGMFAEVGYVMAREMAVAAVQAEMEMQTGIRPPLLMAYASQPAGPPPAMPTDTTAVREPVVSNAAPEGT